MKSLMVLQWFTNFETNILTSLANNETKVDILLERIWEKFAAFTEHVTFEKKADIMNYLSKELITSENECLKNGTCWTTFEKMSRSIFALSFVANQPEYFGNYLGYHVSTLFKKESYIQPERPIFLAWPRRPFLEGKPDEQELGFNKILMNMTFALSGGKLKNVSLLDLPAFGSTLDSFQTETYMGTPWKLQLNMAIYNRLMRSNNNTWSQKFSIDVHNEYKTLKNLWKKYMNDSKANDFPPDVQNNTLLNFTNHIKEDMSTFLLVNAASFPNLISNTTIWSGIAKTLSNETNSENDVRLYGKDDKLIIHCVFQQPFMSHTYDEVEDCTDLLPVLTDNGLCYTFNGIQTSKVWSPILTESEILQTFSTVFGTSEEQTRNFLGIGHSDGN